MHAISQDPQQENTECGSGIAMMAGRAREFSLLLGLQANSQTQGEAVFSLGSGQRAWEAELGYSMFGEATAEKALP